MPSLLEIFKAHEIGIKVEKQGLVFAKAEVLPWAYFLLKNSEIV